jgi:zinc transport system substrate-binding protein
MPARAPLRRFLAGTVVAAALALSGCSSEAPTGAEAGGQGWTAAAAFYPLQYVTEAVGGDLVSVTNLTKPGAEPHDLELAPQDLAQLTDADLAVYLDGFQPAVDDAVAQKTDGGVLDVSQAADLTLTTVDGGEEITDPHFWLDPLRLADVGDAVADSLSQLDPPAQATFDANAAALRAKLERLDSSYREGLSDSL